jgi:hypothetical protein
MFLFAIKNDALWLDRGTEAIHQGVCAAMTAIWIKTTQDNHAPLATKGQLTKADDYESLQAFYRKCAIAQSKFRNKVVTSIRDRLRNRILMFQDVGLRMPTKDDVKLGTLIQLLDFVTAKDGLYSFDLKKGEAENPEWHTIGLYVNKEAKQFQLFEPNFGLYHYDDISDFNIEYRDWVFQNSSSIGVFQDLECYRFPL